MVHFLRPDWSVNINDFSAAEAPNGYLVLLQSGCEVVTVGLDSRQRALSLEDQFI